MLLIRKVRRAGLSLLAFLSVMVVPLQGAAYDFAPGLRHSSAFHLALLMLTSTLIMALIMSYVLRRQVVIKKNHHRESESRLNTILDTVDACIYIKGLDLRYQYVNRKMCDVLQREPEQVLGQEDSAFFDEATCLRFRANDLRVIRRGERIAGEEMNGLVDGISQKRLFLSVKLPLRHPDGSIYALCGISTDITEHRQVQDQLHRLAFFDPLTGLANRRLLLDRLQHALASHAQTHYQGALVLINLDNFKVINDTRSYSVGDRLLCQLARRLEENLRDTDTVARLGADEFVVMLEDLSADQSQALVQVRNHGQALLKRLTQPYDLDGEPYVVSMRLGVALFSDTDGDPETLLRGADLAMAAARTEGRNTLRFFNQEMQHEVNRRTRIETALRRALIAGGLELYLQPQVNAKGRVLGMEALLRWQDPILGQVSPAEFIPVAEANGLIIPVGEWVLTRACHILAEWMFTPGMEELTLAVNISPEQFQHPRFVEHLENCIRLECIDPSLLELEVTEGLLIDDMENTIERMLQLRAHGIRFALDDFGTGYASLGYLKRLPLYQLKIDQSFVRNLLTDANDEAIVSTIIALGKSLDLQVIAEGVETEALAQRLMALGCEYFQGYLYGKPLPPLHWRQQLGLRRRTS